MITRLEAIELASDLTGLRDWPDEEGVGAVNALLGQIERAGSVEIARTAIQRWIEESSFCPKPAEIYGIIDRLNAEAFEERTRQEVCRWCGGRGIYGGEFKEIETLWKYCKCPIGRQALRDDPGIVDQWNKNLIAQRAENDRAIEAARLARKARAPASGAGNEGLRPFVEVVVDPTRGNPAARATAEESLKKEANQ